MLFILILLISLLLQFFLPWWIVGAVAFLLSFWKGKTAGSSFGSGFLAIFLLWIIMGLSKTLPNDNILANRIGQMFGLPDISFNWLILLIITGLIGGLVSGFSALAGYYCKTATGK